MSDRYDPQAADDAPGRSEYLSKKDAKWIAIILGAIALAAYPAYQYANDQKNKALCSNNVKAIGDAMNLYAGGFDERYPPVFADNGSGQPTVNAEGVAETWASGISSYINSTKSFRCPGAEAEESAPALVASGSSPMTYGMYVDHGTTSRTSIDAPDETILVAETSDLGTQTSFDPLPLSPHDVFAIGWNNSNTEPSRETTSVTRLAFRNTGTGNYGGEKVVGRHAAGIHAVTVSGRRVILKPNDAYVRYATASATLSGLWRTQRRAIRR